MKHHCYQCFHFYVKDAYTYTLTELHGLEIGPLGATAIKSRTACGRLFCVQTLSGTTSTIKPIRSKVFVKRGKTQIKLNLLSTSPLPVDIDDRDRFDRNPQE